jgi:parallel beta-helix repeat protein
VFPIVGGWQVKNAAVEGLTIDGNRSKSLALDGCRGGGIYLFECANVRISRCEVHKCNGDGISFQVSRKIVVNGCTTHDNAGHGLHPGSGSRRPILRHNRAFGNDQDGLFVCWRVQHGLFDDNIIESNKRSGFSIGHKDSDNLFQNNRITGNRSAGRRGASRRRSRLSRVPEVPMKPTFDPRRPSRHCRSSPTQARFAHNLRAPVAQAADERAADAHAGEVAGTVDAAA